MPESEERTLENRAAEASVTQITAEQARANALAIIEHPEFSKVLLEKVLKPEHDLLFGAACAEAFAKQLARRWSVYVMVYSTAFATWPRAWAWIDHASRRRPWA